MFRSILFFSVSILLTFSCKSNQDESDEKNDLIYSKDIQPIFTKNCAYSGCHADNNDRLKKQFSSFKIHHSDSTLILTDYEHLAEGTEGEGNAIIPFQPSLSHLFQHINSDLNLSPSAEPKMPPNGLSLSKSDIQKIYDWILQGAKNDDQIPMYSYHNSGQFAITNQAEDFISLIDAETGLVSRIFPLFQPTWPVNQPLQSPHYINLSADKKFAYVTLIAAGDLLKIDSQTGEIISKLNLGGSPAHVELFPDGTKAVVSDFSLGNKLFIIDLSTFTIEKTIQNLFSTPHGLVVMPDNQTVFTAGNVSDLLFKINVSTGESESFRISGLTPETGAITPELQPYQIRYLESKNNLYVSCKKSGEVRVWNVNSEKLTDSIKVGSNPLLMDFNHDKTELWVANQASHSISIINLSSHQVETISDLPNKPHGLKFSSDGTKVGVTFENDSGNPDQHHPGSRGGPPGIFIVIDSQTRNILFEREVGAFAAGIEFLP